MLILKRRENEVIRIGDDVSIKVLDINRGCVRLGITAPRTIEVHREEIYDKIHKDQAPASN